MSYDVGVHCHTCGYDLTNGHGNMTSNVARIWDKAGAPLRDWNGKTGVEVLPQLQAAIAELSDPDMLLIDRQQYEDLVRGGGTWGTYQSALDFLIVIRDAICRDPQASLSIGH